MPSGGARKGAGRPVMTTHKDSVTWRLPCHILNRVSRGATIEEITVTDWVERALSEFWTRRMVLQRRRSPSKIEGKRL